MAQTAIQNEIGHAGLWILHCYRTIDQDNLQDVRRRIQRKFEELLEKLSVDPDDADLRKRMKKAVVGEAVHWSYGHLRKSDRDMLREIIK